MKNRQRALFLRLSLYTAAAIYFLCTSTQAVENGPSLCLFRNLFGVECLTCGVTRGVSSFFHGAFLDAWEYNPLTYAVLALYFLLIVSDLFLLWKLLHKDTSYNSMFEKIWKWVFPTTKK